MDYKPTLPKNVDVSKLSFLPPKKNALGGKSVLVSYAGERLVLQLPVLHIPYGVTDAANVTFDSNAKKTDPKPSRYVLDVSFRGKEENKAIQNFFDKVQEIESKIKKEVFNNRVSWLNDRYDDMEALVNKLFSSNLRFDKDKATGKLLNRYPPTFRVKLPYVNETELFTFDSYDMEGNELNFNEIKDHLKGAKTRLLVQMAGLWFAGGKYGCTWKVVSGHFQKTKVVRYTMVEDSDDEKTPVKGAVDEDDDDDVAEDAVAAVSDHGVTQVSESEEEEEEEEEEEDEPSPPPPPPPPKKKVVTKKK